MINMGTDVSKTAQDTKDTTDAKSTSDTSTVDAEKKAIEEGTKEDVTGLKKALASERKRADTAEKVMREAELSKLPELERFKSQVDELSKENEKLKIDNLRRQIAMELGLPWKIGKRLEGETEEEMRTDGADLLKEYKIDDPKLIRDDKNKRTPTNDAKKSGSSTKMSMNELLRAAAGRTPS
jgi:hypothetical protein